MKFLKCKVSRLKYEGENFEEYYSNLVENTQNKEMILQIEDTIHSYFSALELPDTPTVLID